MIKATSMGSCAISSTAPAVMSPNHPSRIPSDRSDAPRDREMIAPAQRIIDSKVLSIAL